MNRQAAHLFWSTCMVFVLALSAGAPAVAQYTAPGTPIPARHVPTKSEFEDRVKESPWKAGPLALNPWAALRDVSIVTELSGQGETGGEDLTLTVGAGLRGYLPAGSKALFAAHALPEYVWWQDAEAKRRLNGRYGLGFFAFFNRLTLELSQQRIEQQSFFSSEIQELTTSRDDVSKLNLELEVGNNLSLIGIATLEDHSNVERENPAFSAFDRSDESALIGMRFKNPQGWTLELGYQDTSADFSDGARNLSNSGDFPLVSIGLDRSRIGFRLDLAFEEREADAGSEFGKFDDTTGSFNVLWKPSRKLDVLAYVRRTQNYSANDRYSYFLEERQGARCNFSFDRVRLGLFGEVGEDDFETTSPGRTGNRIDDVTAYGADLEVKLREVSFSVRATRTDRESGPGQADQDVTRLEFGVQLEAISRFTARLIDKLSLGSAGSQW